MVQVVDDTEAEVIVKAGYIQNNQQLARDLNEHRQLLSLTRQQLHDLEASNLELQLINKNLLRENEQLTKRTEKAEEEINTLRRILMPAVPLIRGETRLTLDSPIKALPASDTHSEIHSTPETPTRHVAVSTTTTRSASDFSQEQLTPIAEENSDSLVPQSVSSVPTFNPVPEQTMPTPSIFNFTFDDAHLDMQSSTPHRPPLKPSCHIEQQGNQDIPLERPRRGRGRKIQAGSRAKCEVKFNDDPEPVKEDASTDTCRRYNFRKRTRM